MGRAVFPSLVSARVGCGAVGEGTTLEKYRLLSSIQRVGPMAQASAHSTSGTLLKTQAPRQNPAWIPTQGRPELCPDGTQGARLRLEGELLVLS